MIIYIIHTNGRKSELEVCDTDTVRNVMDKFYDKINKPQDKRFYNKEQVIFKNGSNFLNSDEEHLKKTVYELGLEEDDSLEWIVSESINAGKY